MNTFDKRRMGTRIKAWRTSLNLSQEELANKLNMKRSNIANYEAGRVVPPGYVLIDMARIFNVSTDAILGTDELIANLGKFIRKLRNEKDYSIPKFAEIVGIDWGELLQYEDNQVSISVSTLKEIVEKLDIPFSSFMEKYGQYGQYGQKISPKSSDENLFNNHDHNDELSLKTIKVPYVSSIEESFIRNNDIWLLNTNQYLELPMELIGKYALNKDIFIMKSKNESMNKIIPNGSFIVAQQISYQEIKDGDILIFSYKDNIYIKRLVNNIVGYIHFASESIDVKSNDIVIPLDEHTATVNVLARVIGYSTIIG